MDGVNIGSERRVRWGGDRGESKTMHKRVEWRSVYPPMWVQHVRRPAVANGEGGMMIWLSGGRSQRFCLDWSRGYGGFTIAMLLLRCEEEEGGSSYDNRQRLLLCDATVQWKSVWECVGVVCV